MNRSGRRRFHVLPLESLEGRIYQSVVARGPSTAAVRRAAPRNRLDWLIGSASGTAKASPATIELKRGEGNMNGLGGVRTSGRFDFRAETGNLVVTARNNQAIRLEIQNILFRSYKSRSFLTNTYVYEFSIDYKVATTTLAAAPDRGKLLLTVRLLKLGATEYEGVYKARFVPSV